MIDLLGRFLGRLLSDSDADAVVIWNRAGQAATGSVTCTRPVGLVPLGSPWPVPDPGSPAVIQRDPAVLATLLPDSVRPALPGPATAALSIPLADSTQTLLMIWCRSPAGTELRSDLRSLIDGEIAYAANSLAQQGRIDRATQRLAAVVGGLKVGVVSEGDSPDRVTLNAAAARLLGLAPGEAGAGDFAAAMTALKGRALNPADITAMDRQLDTDPWADIECTWRFAEAPTHLRVSSHQVRRGAYRGRVWVFDDVSGTAAAVAASESAHALLRASADSMLDPQVLLEAVRDADGCVVDFRYRSANRAACTYLGRSEQDLIGISMLPAVPAEDRPRLTASYARCLKTGDPVVLHDFGYDLPGGDSRHYDLQASRAGADLLSVTWRDVTERARAAQRIAESELKYRFIAENSGDAIVHARDGRFVWASPSIESVLGAPPEYWLGRELHEAVPPEDRAAHDRRMAQVAQGQPFQVRLRLIGADGVRHWVEAHSKPFYDPDGRQDGFTSTLRLADDKVAAEQRADEARRLQTRADARFRRSMDNAAIGMCIVAPDGRFIEVNAALCELFGYDAQTLTRKTWQELTAPEFLEADLQNVADVLEGRIDSYRMLKQFIHADGHLIWGDLSVSCVRIDDGQVESFVSQIVDVTAAIEATERYRLLAENAGDMVAHIRGERFAWVSPSVADVLGAPPQYWIGREVSDVVPPDARANFAEDREVLLSGGTIRKRVQVMAVDGVVHWVHMHAKPFRDASGRHDGFTVALRMIDDEVAAQQAAEEARRQQAIADARYRRSMDTAAIGMCLLSPDGAFLEVNPALCELLGYDAETLTQMNWQEITTPETLAVGDRERQEVFDGRRDSYRIVKRYIHADGHRIWVDVSVNGVRDENGEIEALASQVADITAEVEAREQLARSDEQNRTLALRLQQGSDRLAAELSSAAEYLASIMPRGLSGPVDVVSRYLPSRELGGDCYDYTWIDDDHLLVYLLDVSGHGIRPALLAVSVHNMLRSGSLGLATMQVPEAALDSLNGMFRMDEQGGHFFTIWYGVYEMSTRTLRYASAGAPPALAFSSSPDGVAVVELATKATPVGMFDDTVFTSRTYRVPPGCRILLCSDGAYELTLDDGRPMAFEEFRDIGTRLAASSNWSLDGLLKELRALTPAAALEDDCSLIQLTFD